jgi:hypothetical protein
LAEDVPYLSLGSLPYPLSPGLIPALS